MAYVVNPVADPLGFIVFFFVFGVGEDLLGTLLKLSILSSVIVFPFTLLGKLIYDWVEKSVKSIHLVKLFLTSLITVFLFIIIIRLWYVLWGSKFLAVGATDFLLGFAVAVVIAFIFALLGDFLNHVVHKQWQVPQGLTLYVIDLIVCFVFFAIVSIAIYLGSV
jgi:hypothetical protein